MTGNGFFLLFLGLFLLLFGLFSVTNIQVEWGKPVMGFSALIAGFICLVVLFRGGPPWNA